MRHRTRGSDTANPKERFQQSAPRHAASDSPGDVIETVLVHRLFPPIMHATWKRSWHQGCHDRRAIRCNLATEHCRLGQRVADQIVGVHAIGGEIARAGQIAESSTYRRILQGGRSRVHPPKVGFRNEGCEFRRYGRSFAGCTAPFALPACRAHAECAESSLRAGKDGSRIRLATGIWAAGRSPDATGHRRTMWWT